MGLDGELDRYQFEQFLQVAGQALSNRKVDHLPENKCTINPKSEVRKSIVWL